ncbi:hypothetical protein [Paenibacillus alba]|uniref:Uncharacterized protein n=1 Tax=Paenibacillus alba TaxID=1197127 RepID=A0ABU6GD55_9BACL|nr:hypothetical protein [Paenibacillus alba]MEC0232147.1 hypothetical protein [Paenibacillus alba]
MHRYQGNNREVKIENALDTCNFIREKKENAGNCRTKYDGNAIGWFAAQNLFVIVFGDLIKDLLQKCLTQFIYS